MLLVLSEVPHKYDQEDSCLYVPPSVIQMICSHCDGEEQQRNQLVHYWISVSPYASWSQLAGRLMWLTMESALALAKSYIRIEPGIYIAVIDCEHVHHMNEKRSRSHNESV